VLSAIDLGGVYILYGYFFCLGNTYFTAFSLDRRDLSVNLMCLLGTAYFLGRRVLLATK
jgi:hypothetical protein